MTDSDPHHYFYLSFKNYETPILYYYLTIISSTKTYLMYVGIFSRFINILDINVFFPPRSILQ